MRCTPSPAETTPIDFTAGERRRKALSTVLRILLGTVFTVSAVAKLLAIDQFELYVYSYSFFSLNTTYVLARLCIGMELALGMFLFPGWHKRLVLMLTLAMLIFFSIFLCYAALIGRTDSCQCFGRLADMPPTVSLLKNAVLIVMVLATMKALVAKGIESLRCWKKVAQWIILAAALAIPFIVSVPDSWMFGPANERYNEEALQTVLEMRPDLAEGAHLVAFVTPGCPYCRMTRQKLDSMSKRNTLPKEAVQYIEPGDLPDGLFLHLTYGARPMLLLMQDGTVVSTYHYRNISERQIVRTLGGK